MVLDMKSRMRFTVGLLVGILGLGLFVSANANTQETLWQFPQEPQIKLQAKSLSGINDSSIHSYEDAQLMTLNIELMRDYLGVNSSSETAAKGTSTPQQYEITMPLPDGRIVDLTLVKDSILPKSLAIKYPNINTYKVLSSDLVFAGKVDISASGFHGMLQMLDGEIVFIDPVDLNQKQYAIFNKSAQKTESHRQHSCDVPWGATFRCNGIIQNNLVGWRHHPVRPHQQR